MEYAMPVAYLFGNEILYQRFREMSLFSNIMKETKDNMDTRREILLPNITPNKILI